MTWIQNYFILIFIIANTPYDKSFGVSFIIRSPNFVFTNLFLKKNLKKIIKIRSLQFLK